jgi:hypothetical protein
MSDGTVTNSAIHLTFRMRTSRTLRTNSLNGNHKPMLAYVTCVFSFTGLADLFLALRVVTNSESGSRGGGRQCLLESTRSRCKRHTRTLAQSGILHQVCAVVWATDRIQASGRCVAEAYDDSSQAGPAQLRRGRYGHESVSPVYPNY